MRAILDFLKERLDTPTERFHAVMVVAMLLAVAGFITADQINGAINSAFAVAAVVGPAITLLTRGAGKTDPGTVAEIVAELVATNPEAVKVRDALERAEEAYLGGQPLAPPAVVDPGAVAEVMDRLGIRR